ncbi:MAG: asparaginase domain-containing protein [Methylococcales bacterium]|nr:asparaginase domain-containing protein [Methylococcales bacterium]MDD5753942.1 asparaginase domain-containing protein [Methylococcales bacterium]
MKKILVVFTGGTIGSSVNNCTIDTDEKTSFLLLAQFKQRYPQSNVTFTTIQPYQILSENLAPKVWSTLITAIENENPQNYDGIIITHGTDTLAYTAAALGFYFHTLNIPIFLVSSHYPLSNENANGLDNFSFAVEKIVTESLTGVFVPYRNPSEKIVTLHKSTRLNCSSQLSNDFFSVLGENTTSKTIFNIPLKPQFSEQILLIKPYPALNYDHINLENVEAVLHDLYHSGTACTTEKWGKNKSLLHFINRCNTQNVAVYLAPVLKSNSFYQSTFELSLCKATTLWNISIEAAYVKLSLAYGNFADETTIVSFIRQNLADEYIN